ncbi:MAG: hypothetical protein IPH62_07715 [Ignavibacteriae bacterium]|nr:hypothetical protein [Ignavibacteriota bacterium]
MLKSIIILLLISTNFFANGKPTANDKKIIELSLNYQFDEADKLLNELLKSSNNLKYHYLYLNVELVKIIKATDEAPVKNRQKVKESLNEEMIKYSEKIISQYDGKDLSIDDKFYFGSIYGLLGRFYGVNKSWMSAFSNGKEGKNILEEIIEIDPNYTDAYLLLGMMNYYADRLSGVTKLITSVLGLSGDRKTGLEYLHKVDRNGVLTNWQATMILIELYSRLENNKFSSLPLLEKMHKNFPNNSHFTNWYCYELMNLGNLKEVEKLINSDKTNIIYDVVKAQFFHLAGNYSKSNEILNLLFKGEERIFPWIYEYAKYMQVVNFKMLNDFTSEKKYKLELEDDYVKYYGKLFDSNELGKDLLKYRELIQLEDFKNAESIKINLSKSKLTNSQKAFLSYYDGVESFKRKNMLNAEKHFIKSKSLDKEIFGNDCITHLIQIYKTTNANKNNVEKLIDEINDLDDERFELSVEELEEKYDL